MGRHYFSHQEDEAYRDGRRDEEYGRRNYDHDRYSSNPVDQAYWEGRRDEERDEERRREEEREMEREMERQQEREYERRMQEERDYEMMLQAQIEDQMMAERAYFEEYPEPEIEDIPPENCSPYTEEQLFMDIQEDERNEFDPEP